MKENVFPFLAQVAKVYVDNERENLLDYCFVFPNKRSGTFFRHYLLEHADGKPLGMPEIATIGDLTSRLTTLVEAPRLEQLFALYDCYRRLGGENIDFDRFMFWGEMILSDFNDVDMYLVDPDKLFVNLKRYREVNANYLTDEQREILTRYWGEQFASPSPEKFWQHLHYDNPTELEQKFLKLWEVLAALYHDFTDILRQNGMGTQGMIAREAVTLLRGRNTARLSHSRYIFVGFNVLTLSELSLFENLDHRGVADFYWDNASPAMRLKENAASRFIDRNISRFHSRYNLAEIFGGEETRFPEIELMGVPSSTGQAKMAGHKLKEWVDGGVTSTEADTLDTAVVLPDDSLLIPLIHSIPESLQQLNVTMGLPLRTTSFASFINLIVSMQLRATQSKGEWGYFHDDVRNVISHPLLASAFPQGCDAITRLFMTRRIYVLPAKEAVEAAPELDFVFAPIENANSVADVYGYFRRLLLALSEKLEGEDERKVEAFFVNAYLDAIDELRDAASRWNVGLTDSTFIQLLQKAMAGVSVNFLGEPLRGLQIMGVLETRALDFKNIIILSMNERIFPRKHYTRSFIPDSLRHSYGMATTDYQESIYAYYFYRLISRAERVAMYYDSRNGPMFTGEMSRYITQLLYLNPECDIRHTLGSYELVPSTAPVLSVKRTPEIKEKLLAFCTPGGKPLSASTINDYVNCPLQFYLKHVCGLDTDEEVPDYMDSATYGSIVHAVAQQVYLDLRGEAQYVKITEEMLDEIINSKTLLDGLITSTVNEQFNRRPKGDMSPLTGEARVMGNIIKYFLTKMFELEKSFAPFDFIDAEHKIMGTMRLAPDLTINIKQYIDRIDRVYPPGRYGEPTSGCIRIIDYKTGADATDFRSMDDLFDPHTKERRKAILQLLFYSKAYAEKFRYQGPVQPFIYRLRKIYTDGLNCLKYNGKEFGDYHEVIDEYMERLEALIREMLLSDKPFTQAEKEESCKFCSFKTLCHRQ